MSGLKTLEDKLDFPIYYWYSGSIMSRRLWKTTLVKLNENKKTSVLVLLWK